MTKQTNTNVLNNLKEIHSLQANGVIVSLIRDLRGYKSQIESHTLDLNQRIKGINQEKVREEQERIAAEAAENARLAAILKQKEIEAREIELAKEATKENLASQNVHIASSSNLEENLDTNPASQGSQSNPSDQQHQSAPNSQTQRTEYGKKRTFDDASQQQNRGWRERGNRPYDNASAQGGKYNNRQNGYSPNGYSQNNNNQNGFNPNYKAQGQPQNQRSFGNSQGGNKPYPANEKSGYNRPFNQNGQSGFNRPFNQNGQNGYNRPFNQNGQGGFNRPYNQNGQSGFNRPYNQNGQNKPFQQNFAGKSNFASTKANNFKTFTPEATETKEQRNFGNKNKSPNRGQDERRGGLNKKQLLRRNYIDTNPDMEERLGSRKIAKPKKKQDAHIAPTIENAVITTENVTVKTLAEKIGKPVPEIIKKLMILGVFATINSAIDFATAELVASELGIVLEQKIEQSYEEKLLDVSKQDEEDCEAKPRPPVIAVMGHVDHGKTSLLDAIRKTSVASGEAGGITQKIGAYSITHNGEKLTFIDTPGHAAFTSMRARGAKITDIAVLVVAADDGVMPQTLEAINHIKAAEVPMIVAINKMDAVDTNPERVKTQLAANGVLPEDWGGDTIIVPVSAKTGVGIDDLINMILLVAEVQNFKANPNKMATGTIIEATLDRNKGPIATVLVQSGTLEIGNSIMSGITFGKVRAMFDENGKQIKKAGPSTPVAVLGFYDVPLSGDQVFVVSEKLSKQVIDERKTKIKEQQALTTSGVTLDDFMNKVNEGKLKSLNIIIKADSQGSVEALKQSLIVIANEEVRVVCIHSGVGAVTESDIVLAKASSAIIINFNLKVPSKIQTIADHTEVEIKQYKIIYEVVEDITKAITGMLSIKYEQVVAGHADVRMVFKLSTNGLVAGCYVTDGKIIRNAMGRLIRNGEIISDTKIVDLKIVKDDKSEVSATFECGIKLDEVTDLKEGDVIECYQNIEIKRS